MFEEAHVVIWLMALMYKYTTHIIFCRYRYGGYSP